jgi:hypothetical protein
MYLRRLLSKVDSNFVPEGLLSFEHKQYIMSNILYQVHVYILPSLLSLKSTKIFVPCQADTPEYIMFYYPNMSSNNACQYRICLRTQQVNPTRRTPTKSILSHFHGHRHTNTHRHTPKTLQGHTRRDTPNKHDLTHTQITGIIKVSSQTGNELVATKAHANYPKVRFDK